MPPRKKATAAKGKKSPDPPARVSPDPPARLSLASSPVALDDESAPAQNRGKSARFVRNRDVSYSNRD